MNFLPYHNGLDGLIINPFLSIFLSVLLILGILKIGNLFLSKFTLPVFKLTNRIFIVPIIGLSIVLLIINPLIYLTQFGALTLQISSIFLCIFGIYSIINFKLREYVITFFKIIKSSCLEDKLSIIILFLYFIIALAPITNADSLDYHIGVPLDILKNSKLLFHPEWFATKTAGIGDFLNGVGLAIGAEQFPGLIQFLCIFSIFGIVRFPLNTDFNKIIGLEKLGLLFLSTPVLLFLGSSSKPQLLAILFICYSISIFYNLKKQISSNVYLSLLLIYVFLALAGLIKFNFFLSAFLIFILTSPIIFKIKSKYNYILLFLIPLLILTPYFIWKISYYNLNFFDSLYNMLPINLPGYKNYQIYLRNYRDNSVYFPFSLFIPFSFGTLSTCIGLGSILFILFFKLKYKPIIFLILAHVSITYFLGQINARFLLETLIIILISISFFNEDLNFIDYKFFKFSLYSQSVVILASLLFFSYSLVVKSFSNNGRYKVMSKSANGYTLYNWLNHQISLKKSENILVAHRSQSLSKFSTISLEWNNYTKIGYEKKYYIDLILDKNPKYLVLIDDTISFPILPGYNRDLISKFHGKEATRNPFNLGNTYTAFLFKLSKK